MVWAKVIGHISAVALVLLVGSLAYQFAVRGGVSVEYFGIWFGAVGGYAACLIEYKREIYPSARDQERMRDV